MARKRKAANPQQEPSGPVELDPRDSRKRIRTYEDVADSDDEFHLNRDEIRLGEAANEKRRRQWAEQEDFLQPSDEEVLGYSDEEEDDSDYDGETGNLNGGIPKATGHSVPQPEHGHKERRQMGHDEDEDEDDFRWGTSKSDIYGADAIETEEQAREEESEALRIQRKQLESMREADYGFDDADWQEEQGPKGLHDEDERRGTVTEILPQLEIPPDMSATERLKLLKSRYPEFEPLSKELLQMQETVSDTQEDTTKLGFAKLRAASAYLGALTVYFSLLTSTASQAGDSVTAMPANQLRDHDVMDSLMKCRGLWLNVASLKDEDSGAMDGAGDLDGGDGSGTNKHSDISEDERQALEVEPKRTRAERYVDAQQDALDARKAERMRRTEAGLADLDTLLLPSGKRSEKTSRKTNIRKSDQNSDLGEENPLTEREAADKAKRRKSLRFYTSQIAQKANKRGAAGKSAGGDDDVPHRERLKDRQARLNNEAEKRGQSKADPRVELGGESDDEENQRARRIREEVDEDDYYDLVAAKTAKKKSDRSALAEAQKQAALEGGRVVQEETVDPDGKRKITYAIEKNKGLTPHRKKDNRNPRVKKRKKYDEKKKKLSSMKAVYKGGEGRGGYGGELTGIKAGLVKSTKL